MEVVRISSLPEAAINAAAEFHVKWLPEICAKLDAAKGGLILVLSKTPYDHDDWRHAAVRDLARAYAPKRVMMVAGTDDGAIADTLAYVADAPGVTGQYLKVD